MSEIQKSLPIWILIISGLFALMELIASLMLFLSPENVVQEVDLSIKGVDYLISMWATRQFALGFILAFATLKKSVQMLTLAYIFLLVMFFGDLFTGISLKNNALVPAAIIMCIVSSLLIFAINKKKKVV
jgi:hypothetical protein